MLSPINELPCYNRPMLIGPVPHICRIRSSFKTYVPDYSYPGVKERIAIEIDMIEDMERRR